MNAKTGKLLSTINISDPGEIAFASDDKVYVTSEGNKIVLVNPLTGTQQVVVEVASVRGLAVDQEGNIFVGTGDPDNQVKVFNPQGKALRSIGVQGGRPLLGHWQSNGMRFIEGIHIDPKGKLWVMENDTTPRRISVWNAADGKFLNELFGPTEYGAGGGGSVPPIHWSCSVKGANGSLTQRPVFPLVWPSFIGSTPLTRSFAFGPKDGIYLAVSGDFFTRCSTYIYQRLAAGDWKLRTKLMPVNQEGQPVEVIAGKDRQTGIAVWADANDDQKMQPEEIHSYKIDLGGWVNGWYLPVTQSLITYGTRYRLTPTEWTACGTPLYDPSTAKKIAAPDDVEKGQGSRGGMGAQLGCGTEDGKLMLYNDNYGVVHSDFQCFDIETGKLKWTYPSNYTGVHGGHLAPRHNWGSYAEPMTSSDR